MKQRINKDDIQLFRKAVGNVEPISQNKVLLSQTKKKKARPALNHRTHNHNGYFDISLSESSSEIGPNDVLIFKRDGIQNKIFKRLKRGQIPVVAELDLHGHTLYQAKISLERFFHQINKINVPGCVRIIHGKGYGSQHATPVIKQCIPGWLQDNTHVMAYCSCRISDGGTGAVYVLIKRG